MGMHPFGSLTYHKDRQFKHVPYCSKVCYQSVMPRQSCKVMGERCIVIILNIFDSQRCPLRYREKVDASHCRKTSLNRTICFSEEI